MVNQTLSQSKAAAINEDQSSRTEAHNQYLTFFMAEEEYGVDILCVQEIRGWESATPLPNAPKHIKGVINLRGTIVPIVDLRQCFGMQGIEYSAVTVVIVLKVQHQRGSRVMGIVVDAVSDVYTLTEEEMRAAPDLGDDAEKNSIRGLATVNNRMVILLNIDQLLRFDELPNLADLKDQIFNEE